MGTKRKAKEVQNGVDGAAPKKSKHNSEKSNLIFPPRPDWHAAHLPDVEQKEISNLPPQRTIDDLHKYADTLLENENAAYNASHISGSSSHKFLSTIMSSGTLEDKVSALTLLVQESPLHAVKAFENLLALSKKKGRKQALMALAALKDLLGQGVVLPGDRKLRAFGKQPVLLGVLQGQAAAWAASEPLPAGIQKIHLISWAYEDWLKRTYFEILQVLESWCGDEIEYSRSRALTFVWELLRDKPEQEENLLRLLVNKLGDTDCKIASRASHLMLQLENTHPAMKMVITNSIESDCLYRPGQSLHAKYYAIITLNQTILGQKEEEVANRLLQIYFGLFVQLLKPKEQEANPQNDRRSQQGGGKPGRLAARKRKAQERDDESELQLRDRMIAQVLTGVNRAFPFADTNSPTFEKQLDTIFRITHSANFNTAVQALMLLLHISSTKHYGAERYYRTLYESLLDPRLAGSSKQVMYLNLLYKSLKADLNAKRVQAFVKRLLQVITMHEPPFVCGVLYLIMELEATFPSIRRMMTDPEVDDEDGEEHFVDVPDEGEADRLLDEPKDQSSHRIQYDAKKRDPEHAHAERSCLWDILPFLQHFHPSVRLFAQSLLHKSSVPAKPDPSHHTLMHFLDRFVYRSARSATKSMHGTSIMQPMAGSNAADLLVKPGREGVARGEVNTEVFWQKKVQDVAADEVFFHAYFSQAGKEKKKERKEKQSPADESEGDEGEEEIWKAITASKPEVEGADDEIDDDADELEGAYEDSEGGSEAGIDLGGEDETAEIEGLSDADDMDGMLDLDSEEDAMFDDEDEVPDDLEHEEEEAEETAKELSRNQQKKKERKKLKQLPTFASAEDYARMLEGEEDEEDGM